MNKTLELYEVAERMARKRGISARRLSKLEVFCDSVMEVKRLSHLPLIQRAEIALDRAVASHDRLSHQTGAENWL